MALDHRVDPLLADPQGRQHGGDVAPVEVGNAAVGLEQVDDVVVQHAALHELDRRDPDPFLEDLVKRRAHAARLGAADVGRMDEGPRVADQAVLVVVRLDEVEVGQMRRQRTREIGIIGEDNVAGSEVVELPDRGHGVQIDEQTDAGIAGTRDHTPFEVDQRAGVVGRFLDEQRARRALERGVHLLARGQHLVAEDLERHRIEPHGRPPRKSRHRRRVERECKEYAGRAGVSKFPRPTVTNAYGAFVLARALPHHDAILADIKRDYVRAPSGHG